MRKHTFVGNYGTPWVVLESIRLKEGGLNFLRSVIMTPRNTAWAPYYKGKMEYINIQKHRIKAYVGVDGWGSEISSRQSRPFVFRCLKAPGFRMDFPLSEL